MDIVSASLAAGRSPPRMMPVRAIMGRAFARRTRRHAAEQWGGLNVTNGACDQT
jgi:hypothetical protein